MKEYIVGKYKTITEFIWKPKYINGRFWFLETMITTYRKIDGIWEVMLVCDKNGIKY